MLYWPVLSKTGIGALFIAFCIFSLARVFNVNVAANMADVTEFDGSAYELRVCDIFVAGHDQHRSTLDAKIGINGSEKSLVVLIDGDDDIVYTLVTLIVVINQKQECQVKVERIRGNGTTIIAVKDCNPLLKKMERFNKEGGPKVTIEIVPLLNK